MIERFQLLNNERIDEKNYLKILRYIKLRVTEKYVFPPEIIKVDGTTIATLGNFSASTGKPKSKKTFNVSAIVASALSGKEVLKYSVTLPEGKKKVLYVDTEQSKCHCHKVMERILKLADQSLEIEPENIEFLMLREYSPEQRRQIIAMALLQDNGIGLVIIDGIRDLMRDINSPGESLDVINDLLKWTSFYNIHIHTVLHLNKGDDNTRGHIGTELNNKAETILQITRSSVDSNISEVKAMHIRDKEFAPFAFRINEQALPELVINYTMTQERKLTIDTIPEDKHRQALEQVFENGDIVGYDELIRSLKSAYETVKFKRGRNTIIELNKFLMRNGIIEKNDKEYHYKEEWEAVEI